MKSTRQRWIETIKRDLSQWHEWFAWFPVRAFEDDTKTYYRWVWLDAVERRIETRRYIDGVVYYCSFRLKDCK